MSSNHRSLTRLFPRHWRTRYGKEIADLVEDMKQDERGFRLRDRFDLARAGLSERGAEIWWRGAHSPRIVALRIVTAGTALVLVLGSALLIGGVFEGQPSPSPSRVVMTATPARLVRVSAGQAKVMIVTPARLVPLSVGPVMQVKISVVKQVNL
jgi:hypothetical protein